MAAMTYESIVAAVRKKLSKADVSSIPALWHSRSMWKAKQRVSFT